MGFPTFPPELVVRVLVVCDGYDDQLFSFSAVPDKTDTYFTLTQFVNSLRAVGGRFGEIGGTRFDVSLAHRDNDLGVVPPGAPNLLAGTTVNAWFTWHGSPTTPAGRNEVDLSHFDVIYLFGFSTDQGGGPDGTNLCWDGTSNEDQLWSFVQFMQDGGGVFAAGDHEDRGAALCGSIPRVRSMRRWWWDTTNRNNDKYVGEGPYGTWNYGISFVCSVPVAHPFNRAPYQNLGDMCSAPAVGPYRLDTVQAGPRGQESVPDYWTGTNENGVPFDRQSDSIPQPLTVLSRHPILAMGGNRYLSFLPDHMHEGIVIGTGDPVRIGPMPATQTYEHGGTTIQEYPKSGRGKQPLPQVIAQVQSVSHATPGGDLIGLPQGDQHVGALDVDFSVGYGAIAVYDGHVADVGRVVTQSSFHHFLDLNLIGDPATQVHGGTDRTGFTSSAGLPYLDDFSTYWFNLTLWLAPADLKPVMLLAALDRSRRKLSFRMAYRPEMRDSGHAVRDVGRMLAQHLERQFPGTMLQDLVESSLEPKHRAAVLALRDRRHCALPSVLQTIQRVFIHGFLGGAMLHALEYPATHTFATENGELRARLVSAGLRGAVHSLAVCEHRQLVPELLQVLDKQAA